MSLSEAEEWSVITRIGLAWIDSGSGSGGAWRWEWWVVMGGSRGV